MYNTPYQTIIAMCLTFSLSAGIWNVADAQPDPICDDCFGTTGDCALPPVASNPDVTAECPVLKIIFILDESGSIAAAGAQPDVEEGVLAFLSGLSNTGAEVALVEFAHQAHLVSDFVEVDPDFIDDVQGYFDGTALNGQIYNAGGSTNWHSAMDTALALGSANLILFFTDGDPTSYMTGAGTVSVCISSGSTQRPEMVNPMKVANYFKDSLSTHIFMLGVGSVNLDTLTNLSGPVAWQPGVNDVMTSDYALESFTTLAQGLADFAHDLCGTEVAMDMLAPANPVCAGEVVSLTIKVVNTGTENAAVDLLVRDTFPAGVTDITCTTNCGSVCIATACDPDVPSNTLEWFVGNLPPGDSAQLTVEVTTMTPGIHTNFAWVFANNVDTSSAMGMIEVLDTPLVDVGLDVEICSGGTAMLTANGSAGTGPYSYNWSNGSAGAENAVSPAVSTQYTVTVTDANLCSATAEIVVNVVDDPLVMSMSDDTTICDGGFALLTSSVLGGTGATEFQWQLYDSIQGWMDITGADSSVLQTPTLTPGVYAYRLSVEQGSGCSAVSGMIAVTVVDDPIVALSVDHPEVCVGGSTRITAQVNGGSSELAYQWQLSHDGVAWTNVGTNTSIHDAPADSAGTFWYRVILTDLANGCNDPVSDSTAVSVVEDATVTLTADEAEVCVDGVINLTTIITGGSAALTIQWQSSNDSINGWTNIPGATDTVYQPPTGTSGVIYYRTVVTDSTSGCSTPDFDIFPVTVYEDPAVLISADVGEVCIGGAAQLSAALTGGSSQLSYHWQASENGVGGWADIGVTNVPFSPPTDSAGTYYYRVRLEDVSAGCNETESNALAFVVRDTSSASVSADTYTPCQGDMVTLQATIAGGSSALSYHWQTSPDGMAPWTDVGVADANYNPPTTTPGPHYFRVRVEDTTSGCNEPVSEALILQVLEPPVASVDHDDAFCYLPNGVINVTFADHPDRDSIEFSLDNQASYQPAVADAAGSQIFAGLAPGTYAVWGRWSEEECPVFLDSVTVVNIPCGTICGKVLDDQLNPISNVKIWLYPDTNGDGNADGQPIDSTYTEGDAGSYCFEDIPIGDYVVVEEQPANYDDVRDYDHLRDSLDTDGVDTLIVVGMDTIVQLADNDIPVTLHADEYDEGNWFIEDPHTGEIQGWVIDDQYTPLPGLKMYLHDDVDQDGNADPLIVDSTTTNVLGHYQFTGVEPGFYVLISEQPAQYSDVSDVDTSIVLLLDEDGDDSADGPDNNIPVRVLPGELDKDNLFVDGRPGSICGQVRMDTGQPLELVTIELYADTDGDGNRDGSPLASIQTDSTGQYCFGNIQPADYVLYEIQPANYDSLSDYDRSITVDDPDGVDTTGVGADNDIPVTLAPGETDADNDFVEDPHLGNITGFVYDDIEAKLSGVTIELYADVNADGIKDSLVAMRVTDGFGNFDFTGYEPGVYILEQIQPFLYGDILDRDTTITLADPDGDDGAEGPNNQIPVVLSAGETDADNAFQEGRPGSICGTVYDDQLNPISNVVLYLYADTTGDGNPDGAPLDSTVSDGDSGNYCFSDLEGGNYVVQEVQPENYDDLSDIDLSITASDPDGDDGPVPDNDIPVTLDWGEEDVNNDFIEDPHPGTIQGSVLDDIGQPITGVTIKLFSDTDGDGNADGPAIDSTVSNLSGAFAFTGVEPGAYVLEETQPANYSSISDFDQTPDPDGNDNAEGADDNIPVIVGPGEDDTDNVFVNGRPGTICGNVRDDRGVPIGQVVLHLYGDANGDEMPDGPILQTIMSDSTSGNYCFENLFPADYVVVQIQPAFYDDLFDYDLTTGAFDPDGNDSLDMPDNEIPVTLVPGESDGGNDFIEDPHPGTISGYVLNDIDTPMVGIVVFLYPDLDYNGEPDTVNPLGFQITAANGSYAFTGLDPGPFVLVENHPAPYSSISDFDATPDPDGDDSAEDADNNIPVILDAGESDTDNNFINGRPGDICGVVEDDLGNPISLVQVRLYADTDGDGNADGAVLDSVLSDSDSGGYCFSDLQPGDYVVEEVQPLNYGELEDYDRLMDSLDTDGDDRAEGTDNDVPVTLTPGETDQGNDFIDIACPDVPQITGDSIMAVCDGGQLVFTAQSQALGSEEYYWDFGEGATPQTTTGVGPHTVQYDWTPTNSTSGANVALVVAKPGCDPVGAWVSTVYVRAYADATISGSTADLCWYGPRSFQPAAPEIPGAIYNWDFGAEATPQTATGYGPHQVEYSSLGAKTVQLTIDPNYGDATCISSDSLSFEVVQCLGNISGGVYSDTSNGPPIPNVLIILYPDENKDGLPDPDSVVAVTFTTVNGQYAFTLLNPGSYVVQEIQPSGFTSLYDIDVSEDFDSVPNLSAFDDLIQVTVEPLITDAGNHFIETLELANITGTVFEDLDLDDQIDPGEGLEGVMIRLYADANNDGQPDAGPAVDSTWTINDGTYALTALDTGNFVLVEEQPAGYGSVRDVDATEDADDVANTVQTDDIIPVSLFPGESDTGNNFEDALCNQLVVNTNDAGPGSLRFMIECAAPGDTVWFDSPLAGQTIVLTSNILMLDKDITIYAQHVPAVIIKADIARLFEVASGKQVALRGLDLIGGTDGDPQGIQNAGVLTLHDVALLRHTQVQNDNVLLRSTGSLILRGTCTLEE